MFELAYTIAEMIRYSCFHFNQVCHEVYGYRNDWQRTVSSEEMNKNYKLIRSNLRNTVDRYPIESLVEVVPRSRTVGNLHEIGKMGQIIEIKTYITVFFTIPNS